VKYRNLSILAVIAVLFILVASFIFVKEQLKETAPAISQAPAQPPVEEKPHEAYTIPETAATSAEETKTSNSEMTAMVKAESAVNRNEIMSRMLEAELAPRELPAPSQEKAGSIAGEVARNPTRKEREEMKARGVIAY